MRGVGDYLCRICTKWATLKDSSGLPCARNPANFPIRQARSLFFLRSSFRGTFHPRMHGLPRIYCRLKLARPKLGGASLEPVVSRGGGPFVLRFGLGSEGQPALELRLIVEFCESQSYLYLFSSAWLLVRTADGKAPAGFLVFVV